MICLSAFLAYVRLNLVDDQDLCLRWGIVGSMSVNVSRDGIKMTRAVNPTKIIVKIVRAVTGDLVVETLMGPV